jgi:hypothetical protein
MSDVSHRQGWFKICHPGTQISGTDDGNGIVESVRGAKRYHVLGCDPSRLQLHCNPNASQLDAAVGF